MRHLRIFLYFLQVSPFHKDQEKYVPEMIFGELLTGSNFDDKEAKVAGGRDSVHFLSVFISNKYQINKNNKKTNKEIRILAQKRFKMSVIFFSYISIKETKKSKYYDFLLFLL